MNISNFYDVIAHGALTVLLTSPSAGLQSIMAQTERPFGVSSGISHEHAIRLLFDHRTSLTQCLHLLSEGRADQDSACPC